MTVVVKLAPVAFTVLTLENNMSFAKVPLSSAAIAAAVSFLRMVTKEPLSMALFVALSTLSPSVEVLA